MCGEYVMCTKGFRENELKDFANLEYCAYIYIYN